MSSPPDKLSRIQIDLKNYSGPGWADYAVGLCGGALAATQLSSLTASIPAQTALSYYFQEQGVKPIHIFAVLFDFLLVAVVALWLFLPKKAVIWQMILLCTAIVAGGLVWFELWRASIIDPSRVFVLETLPFRPINNMGLLGAGIFFGYITLKLPVGRLNAVPAILVRFALAFSVMGLQWMVYDALKARLS